MTTVKTMLNGQFPNQLAALLSTVKLGDFMRGASVRIFRIAPNASPTDMIANVHSIKLPDDAKASFIYRATAIAGTGTKGALTIDTAPMTSAPAAGHCCVTESGDLAFATADAWTSVDVQYIPAKLDFVTYTGPVVASTGVMALPAAISSRVVTIMDANALTGTVTGVAAVIAPGVVPTTTHQVNLSSAKTQVQFRIADAVTSATVKLGLIPSNDLNAILATDAGTLI